MSELEMREAAAHAQAEFIANFLDNLAYAAQVKAELAMAGTPEDEREEELQQLREALEQRQITHHVKTTELRLLLSQMKFKAFQLVGWTAVLLVLLIVTVLLFSQNYQSCWYLWGEEMPIAFWAKHLLIGCAP